MDPLEQLANDVETFAVPKLKSATDMPVGQDFDPVFAAEDIYLIRHLIDMCEHFDIPWPADLLNRLELYKAEFGDWTGRNFEKLKRISLQSV